MATISPTTIVEPGAKIARNVQVGPFCYIGPDVKIESGCVVESNVTLVGKTTIGPDCHIFPMAVIGTTLEGEDTGGQVELGSAISIREHVTIYGGTDTPTTLGKANLVMIASVVGPGATIGDHGIFANCTHIAAGAIIEDYVRTSAFSFVDRGVRVGAYTFTAGYVHVDHDAPPFAMIQGSPYRVRGVNSHNLKACGFGENDIREIKSAFRDLFNGTGNLNEDALQRLADDKKTNPHVRTVIEYLSKQANA